MRKQVITPSFSLSQRRSSTADNFFGKDFDLKYVQRIPFWSHANFFQSAKLPSLILYTNIATQKFKQCKTQKNLYKNYEDFFKKMKIYLTQQFKKA